MAAVDASALDLIRRDDLGRLRKSGVDVVLTPHVGERRHLLTRLGCDRGETYGRLARIRAFAAGRGRGADRRSVDPRGGSRRRRLDHA